MGGEGEFQQLDPPRDTGLRSRVHAKLPVSPCGACAPNWMICVPTALRSTQRAQANNRSARYRRSSCRLALLGWRWALIESGPATTADPRRDYPSSPPNPGAAAGDRVDRGNPMASRPGAPGARPPQPTPGAAPQPYQHPRQLRSPNHCGPPPRRRAQNTRTANFGHHSEPSPRPGLRQRKACPGEDQLVVHDRRGTPRPDPLPPLTTEDDQVKARGH